MGATTVASTEARPATGARHRAGADPGPAPPGRHVRRRDLPARGLAARGLAARAALVAVALPLIVALVALHQRRWYPVVDFAQFEMRLRDVGTARTPLVGTVGRLYGYGQRGNHPGPLDFYLLAPVYRAAGASPWAMQVAMAVNYVTTGALALWIVGRRGGTRLVLAFGAVLVLVVQGFGAATVATPWNPYVAVPWWLVLLVGTWSAVEGDAPVLPVTVLAGSICLQSHLEYLALTAVLVAAGLGATVLAGRRQRGTPERRGRWMAAAVAVGVVTWLPPLVQQVRGEPGNLALIASHIAGSRGRGVGPGAALQVLLAHLDVTRFVAGRVADPSVTDLTHLDGAAGRGAVLLLGWAATAVLAGRTGSPARRLHGVVGVTLAVGWAGLAGMTGPIPFWLGLWAPATAAVMLVAAAWTIAPRADRWAPRAPLVALVALLAVTSAAATADARRATANGVKLSERLAMLVEPTVAALERGDVPGGGRDGRYLVTWNDPVDLGLHGYGLVNELDRLGFTTGLGPAEAASVTPHRTLAAGEYTGVIHLAVGDDIARWRGLPGAVEVVYVDHRTPAQVAEVEHLQQAVEWELRAAGRDDVADHLTRVSYVTLDPTLPGDALRDLSRLVTIGLPTAVFVGPPDLALR